MKLRIQCIKNKNWVHQIGIFNHDSLELKHEQYMYQKREVKKSFHPLLVYSSISMKLLQSDLVCSLPPQENTAIIQCY